MLPAAICKAHIGIFSFSSVDVSTKPSGRPLIDDHEDSITAPPHVKPDAVSSVGEGELLFSVVKRGKDAWDE